MRGGCFGRPALWLRFRRGLWRRFFDGIAGRLLQCGAAKRATSLALIVI
jgi:hypothetical protein